MRRYIPEVRALYERVRRPTITVLVGLGFMTPLGLTAIRSSADPIDGVEHQAAERDRDPAATGSDEPEPSTTLAAEPEKDSESTARTDSKAEAPAEPARTSSTETASTPIPVSRFAQQFKISLSLADQIHRAAVAEGIDPKVAFGLVQTESSFRRTAISSVGAVGYTQLLPSTARWIAPGTKRSDLFNPQTNLRVGFKYLNYLEKKYNGNMRLALTAYNRGPGTVDRLLKQGRNPENGYATKVLRAMS